MKVIEGRVRKAVALYELIEPGDRLAVGVSGGKDSVALLAALAALRRYTERPFELRALILDPVFGGVETDYSSIERLCQQLEVPLTLKRTDIGHVVFEKRQEHNPCSLCARMRRGILHDSCLELGCNKIALGHHMDDAVETLFLNLFHEGRLDSFRPKTWLSRKGIWQIRPLILCEEAEITRAVARCSLPVVKSRCPMDGQSQRQKIKEFIIEKEAEYPGFKRMTFTAMQRGDISGLAPTGSDRQIGAGEELKG